MHIETLALTNFRCFGSTRTIVELESGLTAFIGANGSGKTAACHALRRMFGITNADRTIELSDFHVAPNEDDDVSSRSLRIEVVLAFPEIADAAADAASTVPEFFHRMAADDAGTLKCRLVLEATWQADGTIDGTIDTRYVVVHTFDENYTDEHCVPLRAADRARIQVIYVPPSRDGARQVTAFIRGRLWRAARWSPELQDLVETSSEQISERFHSEGPTKIVEDALRTQWQALHGAGTHADPVFQPLEPDVTTLLRGTELVFQPDHSAPSRAAEELSDGQRSLLHLALTAATVEVEATLATGSHTDTFDVGGTHLPVLTLFVVEEPENSLSPFYLSRIVAQILKLCRSARAQGLLASHSASVLSRIEPTHVRHFRLDTNNAESTVRAIELPKGDEQAAKFIREAVLAHPELYFARFVVLGEGDTEELVIPRLAQARGIELDPSFVAMVPLGGRHTNHFWRLLRGLGIPHATLIDLDYGRAGGGAGRLTDACNRLITANCDPFAALDGYDTVDDLTDELTITELRGVAQHLRSFGVFFADPLDVDLSMLAAFQDAYTKLEDDERGPTEADALDSVLGTSGPDAAREKWAPKDDDDKRVKLAKLLRWYRYLFLTRSKPSTHLRAFSNLTDEQLHENTPSYLCALIDYIAENLDT